MLDENKITSEQHVFRYAIAEYIDSGKLAVGYQLVDIINTLSHITLEEWMGIKDIFISPTDRSEKLSTGSVFQLSLLVALLTYFKTKNIIAAVGSGLISSAVGFSYLNYMATVDTLHLNEQTNKRKQLLLQAIFSNPHLCSDVIYNNIDLKQPSKNLTEMEYSALRDIVSGVELPAAFINLQAFDHNIEQLGKIAAHGKKKIRIATKSLRVPDLIARVLEKGGPQFCGLMCYSVKEAKFLFEEMKMNDILIAYPTVQEGDLNILRHMHESGAKVSLVVDSVDQIKLINQAMQGLSRPFPLVVDMDMSLRYLNGMIHLGVRRSPVRTLDELRHLLHASKDFSSIQVTGVMGYEAGVAGLTDHNPYKSFIMNSAASIVRNLSFEYAKQLRAGISGVFAEEGLTLEIVNGGGSGSANLSVDDDTLTEITAGSALFCPGFVSDFSNIQFDPALMIALQVVRSSDPDYVTCGLGGGIIASGSNGPDKNMRLVAPKGLKTISTEGFGEVQTPLNVTGQIKPQLGWPVFFRPAKGGESTEHFNDVHLIDKGKITGEAKTYRGVGLGPG